ncbi:MAG TPA: hypothetical protein P5169_09490, partial [Kiritimatiellia bacterium]|nr:hypothetical protein [Kiritimatiellia bacterium]
KEGHILLTCFAGYDLRCVVSRPAKTGQLAFLVRRHLQSLARPVCDVETAIVRPPSFFAI